VLAEVPRQRGAHPGEAPIAAAAYLRSLAGHRDLGRHGAEDRKAWPDWTWRDRARDATIAREAAGRRSEIICR
jgi:hypothetical protein